MSKWPREDGTDPGEWHSVVAGPTPLTELFISGSGKDAEIYLALADGRELSLGVDTVTVSTDGAVQARFWGIDDGNIGLRYCGPGLTARSVRVKYDADDPEWQEEFREAVRAWLDNDSLSDLDYCVDADIVLAGDGQ